MAACRTVIDALGSALFYAGAVTTLAAVLSLIRPFHWVGIRTRRRALLTVMSGAVFSLATTVLPNPPRTTAAREMLIDQWLPEWQFGEYHERRIRGNPGQVFAALRRVRSSDIPLLHALTDLRSSAHMPKSADEKPVLDLALRGGFILLGETTDRELLLGAVVIAPPEIVRTAHRGRVPSLDPALFRTLDRPGFARVAMNFRVLPESDGWTRVTTETRVHAVDRGTQRQFARYWRVIYPGSWIIRWSWLRAVEARLVR